MKNEGCLLMRGGVRGLDINRPSLLRNPKVFCRRSLTPWLRNLSTDFTLNDCLFGSVKLTKNADPDKYKYSGMRAVIELNRGSNKAAS